MLDNQNQETSCGSPANLLNKTDCSLSPKMRNLFPIC